MRIVISLLVASSITLAAEPRLEQRYVTRWEPEPLLRFIYHKTMEVNSVRCRVTSGPYTCEWFDCHTLYYGFEQPRWNVPCGKLPPGHYEVEFDLRTPWEAVFVPGRITVPLPARYAGHDTLADPTSGVWPQDRFARTPQEEAAGIDVAWDAGHLYLRFPAGPARASLDALPVRAGEFVYDLTPGGPASLVVTPWSELGPAGPHLGQVLLLSIRPAHGDRRTYQILLSGSGSRIYFGGTYVSGSPGHDDQGPPVPLLDARVAMTGFNLHSFGWELKDALPEPPTSWPPEYDWSGVRFPQTHGDDLVYSHISPYARWLEGEMYTEGYWRIAEDFIEAYVSHLRSFGIDHYSCGFNEPEMYYRTDKHVYFNRVLSRTVDAVRRADPDAVIIAGKFSGGSPHLIKAFHRYGFRDNFDVLDIHPYSNDRRTGTKMGQVVASHEALVELGMGEKQIYLGEGWGPTRDLKDVPRHSLLEPVSAAEADATRQYFWNGYRNLITPRDDYSPEWVLGAKYFTLNDNIGSTYWAHNATPHYNAAGEIDFYMLGDLAVGFVDGLKPGFWNGGLLDFYAEPKGLWFYDFPPSLPQVRVETSYDFPYILLDAEARIGVRVTNAEARPIKSVRVGLRERHWDFDWELTGRAVGPVDLGVIEPGGVRETAVAFTISKMPPGPMRLAVEVDYEFDGVTYCSDDIVAEDVRGFVDFSVEPPRVDLSAGCATAALTIRNNTQEAVDGPSFSPPAGLRVDIGGGGARSDLPPGAQREYDLTLTASDDLAPGVYELDAGLPTGDAVAVVQPLLCPKVGELSVDGRLDDWPRRNTARYAIDFGGSGDLGPRAPMNPFPIPDEMGESVLAATPRGDSEEAAGAAHEIAARAAAAWDEEYLYIGLVTADPEHLQEQQGLEVWRQDSIQIAFDPMNDGAAPPIFSVTQFRRHDSEEGYDPDDHEYAMAATAVGPQVVLVHAPMSKSVGVIEGAYLAVRPEGGFTTYEMALPWVCLAPFRPQPGAAFAMDVLINEFHDGDRYTLGWGGGIANGKYPSRYVPVILE